MSCRFEAPKDATKTRRLEEVNTSSCLCVFVSVAHYERVKVLPQRLEDSKR
jgi:hypothetical protein